jgi:hypothetical protein
MRGPGEKVIIVAGGAASRNRLCVHDPTGRRERKVVVGDLNIDASETTGHVGSVNGRLSLRNLARFGDFEDLIGAEPSTGSVTLNLRSTVSP